MNRFDWRIEKIIDIVSTYAAGDVNIYATELTLSSPTLLHMDW